MSSAEPRPGEKRIMQEDCAEDRLSNGILTLTNQRIIFEKTEGNIATLSKKTGEVLLDISFDKISSVKKEGFIISKLIIVLDDREHKFSVFNNGKWVKAIEDQITSNKVN